MECPTNRSDRRETRQDRPMYNIMRLEELFQAQLEEKKENTAYGVRGDELQYNDERSSWLESFSRTYYKYKCEY